MTGIPNLGYMLNTAVAGNAATFTRDVGFGLWGINSDTPTPSSPGTDSGLWGNVQRGSAIMGIGGALGSAVGAFYAARASKHELKSKQLALKHEATMARFNARAREMQARRIKNAGRQQLTLSQLAAAQEFGATRARQGGRGMRMDEGSALEQRLSERLAQELDEMTISRNTVAAAAGQTTAALNARAQASAADVSAYNVGMTGRSISAPLAAGTALHNQASRWVDLMATDRRFVFGRRNR